MLSVLKNDIDSIVVEVFIINDVLSRKVIHQMELEAGYVLEFIQIENKKTGIYLFQKSVNNLKVDSGDWIEFFGVSSK